MTKKKSNILKTILYLFLIGLLAAHLISEFGFATGIHCTLLAWSFYILCVPMSGNTTVTATLIYLLTKKTIRYAGFFTWLIAILLNVFTYFLDPDAYGLMATTNLLYQIISHPWPYWLVIGVSSIANLYNMLSLYYSTKPHHLLHKFIKLALATISIVIFLYLLQLEIVILLSVKTH